MGSQGGCEPTASRRDTRTDGGAATEHLQPCEARNHTTGNRSVPIGGTVGAPASRSVEGVTQGPTVAYASRWRKARRESLRESKGSRLRGTHRDEVQPKEALVSEEYLDNPTWALSPLGRVAEDESLREA